MATYSSYPENADVFADRTGASYMASSDVNTAYEAIEQTQGLIGALGKPQSWSNSLITLLKYYVTGMEVGLESGIPVIKAGSIALQDTNGSLFCYKENTADITLATANIDNGTTTSTYYYIYGYSPVAGSTCAFIYSSNPVVPDGIGTQPYSKIGWFYNSGGSSLLATYSGNIKYNGNLPNANMAVGESYTSTAAAAFEDLNGQVIEFVSNGRPVKYTFGTTFKCSASGSFKIVVDGTDKIAMEQDIRVGTVATGCTMPPYIDDTLAAGGHTAKVQWFGAGANIIYAGVTTGTMGARILTVEEL